VAEIQDEAQVKRSYTYWRMRIFIGMYLGYVFYYFSRKSYAFAMPAMIHELGFTKSELGILGSVMALTYGISKFLNGVLSDRSNPRMFMGTGLLLTGVFNIFFGLSSSIIFFALFWGLNGWFQGWGAPPCARLLTHWYSHRERGTWWGFWNTSHSVGGGIIPLIAAGCAQALGWRYAMFVPGALCIGMGLFVMFCLRDTPESLGLPAVEKYRNDYPEGKVHEEVNPSVHRILVDLVLKNGYIWVLAISYFFVYVVRTAVNDWGALYLVETKGHTLMTASLCITWFELGGICGSLLAGWASDRVFRGYRIPVCIIFSLLALLAICGFRMTPAHHVLLDSCLMFSIGMMIFGPQFLIGMVPAELSHKKAAGTAVGFVGWWAYLGAAAAGYPLGALTQKHGWDGFFTVVASCAVVASLLLLPMWKVRANPKYSMAGRTPKPLETPSQASIKPSMELPVSSVEIPLPLQSMSIDSTGSSTRESPVPQETAAPQMMRGDSTDSLPPTH